MIDVDTLPPTQSLALEVLAARYRLGETIWTFSTRHKRALDSLRALGLAQWKHGIMPRTLLAWLTEEGKRTVLSGTYQVPAAGQLCDKCPVRTFVRSVT